MDSLGYMAQKAFRRKDCPERLFTALQIRKKKDDKMRKSNRGSRNGYDVFGKGTAGGILLVS